MAMDVVGAVKLQPLRRGLIVDSVVDVLTFYVPHRFVYDNWVTFIEEGIDTSEALATENTNASKAMGCLPIGGFQKSTALPKFYPEGYRLIWNNYFRPPTTVAERSTNMGSWTDDECEYGWRCANLKSIWTALLANDVDASDYEVPVSGGAVSLLDVDAQSGHLRTEQEREFFNVRYRDIIRNQGGSTDISADDRPELVMRSTFYASGYDVDGTDQSSLGQHTGRVNAAFRHRVPRKFLPEHGMIWTVALVRFPVVHEEENHYFCNNPSPTYLEIAGDPALLGVQPPFGLRFRMCSRIRRLLPCVVLSLTPSGIGPILVTCRRVWIL
jgi:hypothetical protein